MEPTDTPRRHGGVRAWATGLVLLVVVASCGTPPPRASEPAATAAPETTATIPPAKTITDELREARERWETADLSTYHYLFMDDCGECSESASRRVVVWDDELFDPRMTGPSMEDAFSMIEEAVAEDRPVDVTFDPELGFPTEIWIDREARASDGGTHWILSDVTDGFRGSPDSIESHRDAKEKWAASDVSSYEYRMQILCDCELESAIWIHVEGGLIVDWAFDPKPIEDVFPTPLTMDQLLEDIEAMISTPSGFVDAGVRTTGSAVYDEDLGYPMWIGFDFEVVDPTPETTFLPPRLILAVTDFATIATDDQSELDRAKAAWTAAELDDYSYLLALHDILNATFSDPLEVVVSDGAVTSTSLDGASTEIEGPTPAPIDGYFDLIEQWADAGWKIDVMYHTDLGHPVFVVAIHPDGSSIAFSISELTPG